jgi:DNA modification methylase
MGTGTTTVAGSKWGRNSIGIELDPAYFSIAERRIRESVGGLFPVAEVHTHTMAE